MIASAPLTAGAVRILEAVSDGRRTFDEIAPAAGIRQSTVSALVEHLAGLGMVKREHRARTGWGGWRWAVKITAVGVRALRQGVPVSARAPTFTAAEREAVRAGRAEGRPYEDIAAGMKAISGHVRTAAQLRSLVKHIGGVRAERVVEQTRELRPMPAGVRFGELRMKPSGPPVKINSVVSSSMGCAAAMCAEVA